MQAKMQDQVGRRWGDRWMGVNQLREEEDDDDEERIDMFASPSTPR